MKLVQTLSVAVGFSCLALGLGGCASRAAQPVSVATNIVSTTQVTSADVGDKHAPTPKVGKADHVGSCDSCKRTLPSLGDDKAVTVKDSERRSYEVFGDWK